MKPPSRRRFPFRKEVRPLKDDEEIGQRWKCSNVWRLLVLIGRGLDLREREKEAKGSTGRQVKVKRRSPGGKRCVVLKVRGRARGKRKPLEGGGREEAERARKESKPFPVAMARGSHLFPFRTQQLSLLAPKVLGWTRPGRLGRCRNLFLSSSMAEHSAVNRRVVGSSPTWGAVNRVLAIKHGFFFCRGKLLPQAAFFGCFLWKWIQDALPRLFDGCPIMI